eukprot:1191534-Prorocentrum_minimum.AAC.2
MGGHLRAHGDLDGPPPVVSGLHSLRVVRHAQPRVPQHPVLQRCTCAKGYSGKSEPHEEAREVARISWEG